MMSRYHWGFIVGPKTETDNAIGIRYHAKNRQDPLLGQMVWVFEQCECRLRATNMLLVRIMIGKVEEKDRLEQVMRSVPVVQGDAAWNCVIWVKEALQKLRDDGKVMGTSQLEWNVVKNAAMSYVQRKKDQHRFDGQGNFDAGRAATYDLLAGTETIQ